MANHIKYATQITKAWIKTNKGANGDYIVSQMDKIFQGAIDNMIKAEKKINLG